MMLQHFLGNFNRFPPSNSKWNNFFYHNFLTQARKSVLKIGLDLLLSF